ncbi:mitotic checkpoint protein-domain-containing protein [Lactarius deliciosus]|nr:mitotic checkpoint protein-domain-containing protein [Lactarius deliciosus]
MFGSGLQPPPSHQRHYHCHGLVANVFPPNVGVTNNLGTEADQDVRSLRRELGTLKEDYADLQDKLDMLSHSTSRKLAAQAAELTSRECQVDSPSAQRRELCSLIEPYTAIEVLLEQNYTLKRWAWTSCARRCACRVRGVHARLFQEQRDDLDPTYALPFPDSRPSALEEKEEEAERDREKIEELEARANTLLRSTGSNLRTPRSSSASPHAPTNPHNSDANAEEQLVPCASWAAVCEEKAQLEAELKQRDKRMLRLRQVFAGKTAEFREALSAILGVKLAFYDNGQVRVTSQYDLGAAFIFQPAQKDGSGGGARMQLVAQELPQLMRNWVEIEQSIPCFLASVTLECYDKWKREQQNGRKRD